MNSATISNKYRVLSELGTQFNLSFSSQLVFGNRAMALDGLRKKLLVLQIEAGIARSFIIDLSKTVAIAVKKTYGKISQGELKHKDMDEFLTTIELEFESLDGDSSFTLPLYNSNTDEVSERPKMSRNAKLWQLILSKIAGVKNQVKYATTLKQRNHANNTK